MGKKVLAAQSFIRSKIDAFRIRARIRGCILSLPRTRARLMFNSASSQAVLCLLPIETYLPKAKSLGNYLPN